MDAHKTKAALQGRQCHYQIIKQKQHTRVSIGGQRMSHLNSESADFIQLFGSSLTFFRWRRLISLSKAATTNCPVLSPGSFHCSIESATSCGTLAAIVCDFPLTALVAMSVHSIKGVQQYGRNKKSVQHLTCSTPCLRLVFNTLCFLNTNTAKPGSVTSTNRASDHNVKRSNENG